MPRTENTKKAAGNAKKAEAAAAKQAEVDRKKAAEDDKKWAQGAKDNSKQDAAATKAAEAARKKAEKDALQKEEEASLPSKGAKPKSAQKKSRGLDLSGLDAPSSSQLTSVNATGIDNALDALSLDKKGGSDQIDRHPERRFKAAYTVFEERRLEEMKDEKSLRRNQKIERIKKEFERSPENPFNQVSGAYNSTREELRGIQDQEREKMEARLANA
ncbi:MAG: hypothetical protein M1820_010027 [Bogoriella megaspora]|nr:MAG: hypothetical protein M1820_010027 [Bogoriella megaspora]